jgi:hypothetical protein
MARRLIAAVGFLLAGFLLLAAAVVRLAQDQPLNATFLGVGAAFLGLGAALAALAAAKPRRAAKQGERRDRGA